MKTQLEKASYKQLILYAQSMGLDVAQGSVTKADCIALIQKANPDLTDIEVDAAEVTIDAAPAQAGSDKTHYSHDPKVVVNIASDDANGGSRHFPLTCNGDIILVKRDVNVAIPYRHYIVLKNAVETLLHQENDPLTNVPRTIYTDRYAVRFSVVEMPSPGEIEAFHERTRNVGAENKRKAA